MSEHQTMTGDTDVEAIVAKLTKAQRKWLLSCEPTLDDVPRTPCASWWDRPGRLYVKIDGQEYWLGSKSMNSPEGESSFTIGSERLYPLGLAVRAHLTKDTDHAR